MSQPRSGVGKCPRGGLFPRAATFRPKIAASRGGKILRYFPTEREAPFVSPAKTARTLASTQCFSLSVMMPASRRQLALKDMKDAEGASLIGKISSRFTAESMAVSKSGLSSRSGRSPSWHPRGFVSSILWRRVTSTQKSIKVISAPRANPKGLTFFPRNETANPGTDCATHEAIERLGGRCAFSLDKKKKNLNMTGRCDKRVTSARHKITPAGDEKVRQRPPSYPTPP
jgi:hypothetical protein